MNQADALVQTIFESEYGMLLFFFSALIVGLPVVLPIIFAAVHGVVSLFAVTLISLMTSLVSDVFWYVVGHQSLQLKKYAGSRIGAHYIAKFRFLCDSFFEHALKLIFISRFMYGTKNATAFLSGRAKIPFMQHLVICFLSVLVWLLAIIGLASIVQDIARYTEVAHSIRIAFAVFIGVVFVAYIGLGYMLKRGKLLRSDR